MAEGKWNFTPIVIVHQEHNWETIAEQYEQLNRTAGRMRKKDKQTNNTQSATQQFVLKVSQRFSFAFRRWLYSSAVFFSSGQPARSRSYESQKSAFDFSYVFISSAQAFDEKKEFIQRISTQFKAKPI